MFKIDVIFTLRIQLFKNKNVGKINVKRLTATHSCRTWKRVCMFLHQVSLLLLLLLLPLLLLL